MSRPDCAVIDGDHGLGQGGGEAEVVDGEIEGEAGLGGEAGESLGHRLRLSRVAAVSDVA